MSKIDWKKKEPGHVDIESMADDEQMRLVREFNARAAKYRVIAKEKGVDVKDLYTSLDKCVDKFLSGWIAKIVVNLISIGVILYVLSQFTIA